MDANRRITAGLLACLLALPVAAQSSGKTVRKHRVTEAEPGTSALVREAEAALDKQDYPTAETKLKAAVAAAPADYQAWFYLGYLYNQTNRQPEALDAYRHSVAAKSDVFEANLNLGLLLAQKDVPDAEKYLRAATRLTPTAKPQEGRSRAWLSLARFLSATRPDDALAAYAEAVKLRPNDPEPHIGSAAILEKQKKYPEAQAEFAKAAELDPKSTEALAGLVNVATEQRHFDEAEAMLRRYLAADPQNGAARAQLGRILAAEQKFPEAATELEAGLASSPNDLGLARELAAVYTASGQWQKAGPIYEQLIQQQPRDAEMRRVYGVALMKQRRFRDAEVQLVTAVKLDPKLADAYGDLAVAASEDKNYQLSLQALDVRAHYLPETPATLFLRATDLDNLHLFKPASEYYKKFLEAAAGQFPDLEWKARHRLVAIDPKSR
ncbi:MAG TPA: tetratricopeptide repeat protein [Terriglobales bacterium]|nr:tetratricopeptide repeat protein [Terriglobales bacterium]